MLGHTAKLNDAVTTVSPMRLGSLNFAATVSGV